MLFTPLAWDGTSVDPIDLPSSPNSLHRFLFAEIDPKACTLAVESLVIPDSLFLVLNA